MIGYRIIELLTNNKKIFSIHEIAKKLNEDELKILIAINSLQELDIIRMTVCCLSLTNDCSCYYSMN